MTASNAALARRLPAVILHLLVALVDFSFAVGEGAVRVAGGLLSLFLGGKAFENAVEGFVGYLLFGNVWWPLLHGAAAVLALLGRHWLFGALLVGGRAVFLLVNGRPWLDIGGARWPDGLPVVYGVVLAVLGAAQWLARPAAAWEQEADGAGGGGRG